MVGAVERGGRVVARVAHDLTGKALFRFLKASVEPKGSLLITDELAAYGAASKLFNRAVVNHKERYADGATHTNTIESFWALIKRAWYGSHHHYSHKYMPLFIAESCWKYNQRKSNDAFSVFMRGCMA